MKKGQIRKRFITAIVMLGVLLVLIWTFFYILTKSVIDRRIAEQTSSASEAILYGIEEELLVLENSALELANSVEIAKMLKEDDIYSFYKTGAFLSEVDSRISGYMQGTDNVVVYVDEGRYFRLRGTIDNTALKRAYMLVDDEKGGVISTSAGNESYIGTYEPVKEGQDTVGYVALFMEESKIERMLRTYNQSDDIGVILHSRDRILCADKPNPDKSLEEIRDEAAIIYEKDVGLSGFELLVYSYGKGIADVSSYFRIALPITILILFATIGLFAWHVKNNMVEPIELMRERTEKYLLKKQISAHFTVNTLNVIRALIYKGDKEVASDTCDELAGLLRYANAGDDMILLSDEIYTLEQYVQIMCTRYPGMIESDMDMDDFCEEVYVPRMLLQPIVENAITHGLSGNKGRICLSVDIQGDDLFIRISDDGKGMDEDMLSRLKRTIADADNLEIKEPRELKHISLQNIERRIRTECGEAYGIDIMSKSDEGTTVTVHLPVKNSRSDVD